MAKRRRRKITIKNSSLFAFFALVSLFLLDENCAYQHQNPYRFNSNQAQLQQHHYLPSISTSTNININHHQQAQQQQQQQQYQHQLSAQLQFAGSGRELAAEKSPRSSPSHPQNYHHHQQQQQHQHRHQDQQLHSPQQQSNQLHLHHLQQQQPHRILPTAQLCSSLPTQVAKLLKLCKLISQSPDADEVISNGASKGLAECRSQFKHERWNCTHSGGDHQLLTSELAQSIGNPESGFLHAIAAAGIVHSIATACSVGNLSDCACDKSRIGTIVKRDEQPVHWKWGGCSNNIRHGMLFAKHLVELLDAVHQHSRLMQLHHHQQHQYRHQLGKRSTTTNRDHLFNNNNNNHHHQRPPPEQQVDLQRNFCQQNHNISQAKHHELIKSLLSRNSLEKHQEFRLAMNMHNNKIGRNAVAKNMELHCRCHGLSGSCSLKTCWLSLPSLQVIGKYLKKKYESSVHLPKAVNLNKLIPMMDRQEISAILSAVASQTDASSTTNPEDLNTNAAPASSSMLEFGQADNANQQQQQQHQSSPEYAALISSSTQAAAARSGAEEDSSGHEPVQVENPIVTPMAPTAVTTAAAAAATRTPLGNVSYAAAAAADERLTLYERHHPLKQPLSSSSPSSSQVSINEIPTNLEPLSQQQYQALLKEMKLCVGQAVAASSALSSSSSHLQTRDLNQFQAEFSVNLRKKQQHYGHILNGQQTKSINQQLSHLLHSSQKDELIHLHKSPKYCDADLRHGFLGIQSRVCSNKESAPDSCDRLCCGRGHRTLILHTVNSCNCKFQYCCTVTCDLCPKESRVLVCN